MIGSLGRWDPMARSAHSGPLIRPTRSTDWQGRSLRAESLPTAPFTVVTTLGRAQRSLPAAPPRARSDGGRRSIPACPNDVAPWTQRRRAHTSREVPDPTCVRLPNRRLQERVGLACAGGSHSTGGSAASPDTLRRMCITPGLESTSGRSQAGRQWLADHQALKRAAADRWQLEVGRLFTGSNVSFVWEATRADGTPAVLKLNFPEPETEH